MKTKLRTSKFLLLGILLISLVSLNILIVSGAAQNTYCAERTTNGAWCQNVPLSKVDQNFRYAPTSCESTSYCKLGTCVDSQEGTCMENTPQITCELPEEENKGGVWFDSEVEDVPQCNLGCCILGEQAAFVTQTRCKQLSSLYGLETNYRTDIQSEFACISTATSKEKGACVFEKDFEKNCKLTTRGECDNIGEDAEFHEGFLCSSEKLGTNCGPSEKTTLVDGKDGVYFVDTCSNLGNIYDANRQNDKSYWEEMIGKEKSCGFDDLSGNCDYFLGSTGKKYSRGDDPVKPRFGDYICRNLGCEYLSESFQHGETWCAPSSEDGKNLPGSRYNRLVCYNGEVSVEACSEFRQEVCIQDEINGFKTGACRVNKWQDCSSQSNQQSCENTDKRDCTWTTLSTENDDDEENKKVEVCLPKFAPGFDFWNPESDAESLCSLGNNQCIVKFEKGLLSGEYECTENCECLDGGWAEMQNRMCMALGDCGVAENYLGYSGYNQLDDLISVAEYHEESKSSSSSGSSKGSAFSSSSNKGSAF